MNEKKIIQLENLLEEINQVNSMLKLHSLEDESERFMHLQYKNKKDKLISQVIDHLVTPSFRSTKSFALILKLLEKQYPHLKSDAKKDHEHKYLEILEHKIMQLGA